MRLADILGPRITAELQQAVEPTLAVSRPERKARQPRPAKATPGAAEQHLRLPDGQTERLTFLVLAALAFAGKEDGKSGVVPHSFVAQGLDDARIDLGGKRPVQILQELATEGFVRQIVSRKGTLCWIPTFMDEGTPDARMSSGRAERASKLKRMLDKLETSL